MKNKPNKPKYKVTVEYLGIADNEQVAEEITSILKEQFIRKILKELESNKSSSNQ